jgi:hypothetical protein
MKRILTALKKARFLLLLAALFIGILMFVLVQSLEKPENLGPKLEYIGTETTGCPLPLPLGYLLLCSQEPGKEYYFATDMREEELKSYFKNAYYPSQDESQRGTDSFYKRHDLRFNLKNDMGFFIVYYYYETEQILAINKQLQPKKQYIVSIRKDYYPTAKSAL